MWLGNATPMNTRCRAIHETAPTSMMRLAPNISASTPDDHPANAATRPYMVNSIDACDELNPWSTTYFDRNVSSKPSPVMNTAMARNPGSSVLINPRATLSPYLNFVVFIAPR